MTIGALYEQIEILLKAGPMSMGIIYRELASTTDATIYDVTSAVNALVRAGRVELVHSPGETQLFGLPGEL